MAATRRLKIDQKERLKYFLIKKILYMPRSLLIDGKGNEMLYLRPYHQLLPKLIIVMTGK